MTTAVELSRVPGENAVPPERCAYLKEILLLSVTDELDEFVV
jgi:hypothetical protein